MRNSKPRKGNGHKSSNKDDYTRSNFPQQCRDDVPLQQGPKPGHNDADWYIVSDQVLNDVARIPYNIPVGMPFARYGTFNFSDVTLQSYDDALPGLMVSHVMPCLGSATSAADPVNVAANSVFQFVRSKISGSRNYEAVDMMLYLGAMDSIYSYVTHLTRLYSTVFTYHTANRYLARALVEAQHVDYDNIVSNLANFRAGINMRIAKIRALYLPSIMPIFKRHTQLFSAYYIEGASEKDQIYFHVPEGVHLFQYDANGLGMLRAVRFDTGLPLFTYQDLLRVLDAMVDPVYQDEDFNRISGDFLKAYGEKNVFTLTEVPDITTVSLLYNEVVLNQFHNAKYHYVRTGNSDDLWYKNCFDYTQDSTGVYLLDNMHNNLDALDDVLYVNTNGNNLSSSISASSQAWAISSLASSDYEWSKSTMLTSKNSDVDPKENMINTRLTLSLNISADNTSFWGGIINKANYGTEWPVRYQIITYHRDRVTHQTSTFGRWYDRTLTVSDTNSTGIQQLLDSQLPIRSAFKYLPELSILFIDMNTNKTYNPGRNLFEVDNYALVDATTIGGLHDAAILGEYKIPEAAIGK